MTDHRPAARRRRLRRARPRAVARARPTPIAARVRRRRRRPSVGANQLADVRWSAVFDDVELTAADIARLAKEARPLIRSGGRWVAIDKADLSAAADALARSADDDAATGAEMLRLALGLEGSPLAGGISVEGGGWAADLLAAASERLGANRPRAPEGLRRRAAQLPGRSAGVARLPRLRRPRWLPRPRHGSRQDADDARPPARRRRPRSRARDRAARGRRQLGGGGGALHAGAARGRAPRREPRRRPTRSPTRSRDADVVITTYGTAVRDIDAIAEVDVGARRSSTRRRRSRTPRTTRRSSCAGSPRAHASRSPARRSRTVSATCGRSSTSPTPASSGRARSSSPACRDGDGERQRRVAGRRRAARAQRHPRVPAHEGRARDRRPSCPTRSTSSTTAR